VSVAHAGGYHGTQQQLNFENGARAGTCLRWSLSSVWNTTPRNDRTCGCGDSSCSRAIVRISISTSFESNRNCFTATEVLDLYSIFHTSPNDPLPSRSCVGARPTEQQATAHSFKTVGLSSEPTQAPGNCTPLVQVGKPCGNNLLCGYDCCYLEGEVSFLHVETRRHEVHGRAPRRRHPRDCRAPQVRRQRLAHVLPEQRRQGRLQGRRRRRRRRRRCRQWRL